MSVGHLRAILPWMGGVGTSILWGGARSLSHCNSCIRNLIPQNIYAEVAAAFGPFIVLSGQHGTKPANDWLARGADFPGVSIASEPRFSRWAELLD